MSITKMRTTPLKAIQAKCKECAGGSVGSASDCASKECPLFSYRPGVMENRSGFETRRPFIIQVSSSR